MYSSIDTRFLSLNTLHDNTKGPRLYIEDLVDMSDDEVNETLLTIVEGSDIDNIPSCLCGKTIGNILPVCPHCNTEPVEPINAPIRPSLWIKAPQEIGSFISPIAMHFLSGHYNDKNEKFIDFLCDVRYKPGNPNHKVYHALKQNNIPHGDFAYFVRNLFPIMKIMNDALSSREWDPQNKQLFDLLKENEDAIFTRYLPIPSKAVFVLEKSSAGNKGDNHTALVLDSVRTMMMLNKGGIRKTKNRVSTLCYRTLSRMVDFYYNIIQKVGTKAQLLRKHVYGSKTAWVGRAVVSSITSPHRYDEIHLPYALTVSLFKLQIAGRLFETTSMSERQIQTFINENVNRFDPLMMDTINDILAMRGVGHYVKCLLNRNPTIKRLGIQSMNVTKVKSDVHDYTISTPAQNLKGSNTDGMFVPYSLYMVA